MDNSIKPMTFDLKDLEGKAKNGDKLACYILGRSYDSEENGAEQSYEKARTACKNSEITDVDHFVVDNKMVEIGSGAKREQKDYKLTRYACYLIAQNANPRLKIVALAQTYFAIQTRKQEISEKEYSSLTEDEKRFYQRNLTKKGNYSLNQAAKNAGVKNFDKFHNSGYKGLYKEHYQQGQLLVCAPLF